MTASLIMGTIQYDGPGQSDLWRLDSETSIRYVMERSTLGEFRCVLFQLEPADQPKEGSPRNKRWFRAVLEGWRSFTIEDDGAVWESGDEHLRHPGDPDITLSITNVSYPSRRSLLRSFRKGTK